MDVAEAVNRAKAYVADVFAGEGLSQLRLEEVEFDEAEDVWLVTVSGLQPAVPTSKFASDYPHGRTLARTYKVVRMADNGGGVPSVKVQSFAAEDEISFLEETSIS